MKAINNLLHLFHRKQRFNPQYASLSSAKKWVFYSMTGFTIALGLSKFMMSDLKFAFEPTEENKLTIKLIPALDRVTSIPFRVSTMPTCSCSQASFSVSTRDSSNKNLIYALRSKNVRVRLCIGFSCTIKRFLQ